MNNNFFFRTSLKCIGLISIISPSLFAQDLSPIEQQYGKNYAVEVLAHLNDVVAGKNIRVNARKTLIVKEIKDFAIDGCHATALANIVIKKKSGKESEGMITIMATAAEFHPKNICFTRPKVKEIKLSNTPAVVEAIYIMVANRALPDKVNIAFSRI